MIVVLNRLLQGPTLAIYWQTHKDGNGARSGSPVSAVTCSFVNRARRETPSPLGLKAHRARTDRLRAWVQVQIEYQKQQAIKRQEADNEPKQRQLDMQKDLNIKNADVQLEALRATQLTKVNHSAPATAKALLTYMRVQKLMHISSFPQIKGLTAALDGSACFEHAHACRQRWMLKPPQELLRVRPRP